MAKAFKVLWAVNPWEENEKGRDRAIELLNLMAKKQKVNLQMVHVLSPEVLHWGGKVPVKYLKEVSGDVQKKMEDIAGKLKGISVQMPKVLLNSEISTEKDAKKVLSYAKKNTVDAILVSSHSKSDLRSLFIGSFTEYLMAKSKIPMIVVKPEMAEIKKLDVFVHPNDLTMLQNRVFQKLTNFVKLFKGKLKIVHKVPAQIDPFLQGGSFMLGGGWIGVTEFFQFDWQARKKKLEDLKSKFKKLSPGVSVEMISDPGSVAHNVVEFCDRNKADIVLLHTGSKTTTGFVLGSVARAIVKESKIPVWIIHN